MWTYVAADLAAVPVGEIWGASEKECSRRIRRVNTAQFRIPFDHPQADFLLNGDALVKAYEDGQLRFIGDVISAEEVGGTGRATIQFNCAGGLWRFGKRRIGKSTTGFKQGDSINQVDRTQMAVNVINEANADHTGVIVGRADASSLSFAGPWYYHRASEAISEIGVPLDGFEYEVEPVEPSDFSGFPVPIIGRCNIAPRLGVFQQEAIFEYGFGKSNVASYRRVVNREGLLNRGYCLPPGFPDSAVGAVQTHTDQASIDKRGVFEDVVESNVVPDPLRERLVREHVNIRRYARQIIDLTPSAARAPRFGVDFNLGDTVIARAKVAGKTRFNLVLRIYGVTWSVDDNGRTKMTLELVSEEGL